MQFRLEDFPETAETLKTRVLIEKPKFVSTYDGRLTFPTMNAIQEEALALIMQNPRRHGAVVNPVGSGKTLLILRAWAELGEPSLLVVVPRIVLIQNPWLQEMDKIGLNDLAVGQYYGEMKSLRPITVALYQTLLRHPEVLKRFEMVVFDECDVLGGETYGKLLTASAEVPYVFGLTGTIRDAYDRSPRLRNHLPRIIERSIADAREQNLVVGADVENIEVSLTTEERTEYDRLTKAYNNLMWQASRTSGSESGLYKKKAFMVGQKRFQLLSLAQEKVAKVLELVGEDPKEPTLVYSSSVHNVLHLKRLLVDRGVPCEALTMASTPWERKRAIEGFGKRFFVLLSVGVLARGYNVPEVTKEILIGTTSNSLTAIEQRLGRALRIDPKNPDKQATIYVVAAMSTIDYMMVSRAREALTRLVAKKS